MTRLPETDCVHGPQAKAPGNPGASPAIHPASVYAFKDLASTIASFTDLEAGYLYSRHDHPTGVHVEGRLAALEGAEDSVLFGSGMGALAACLHAFAGEGGHVLAARELYGGTRLLLEAWAQSEANQLEWLDPAGAETGARQRPAEQIASRIRANTRVVLMETPTNPLLRVVDLEAAHRGVMSGTKLGGGGTGGDGRVVGRDRPALVVDATLGTPIGRRVLAEGVDVVVHSATKYLGGHDDILAGVASGSRAVTHRLREARKIFGATGDPQTAWLLDRGIKTLAVRWDRQCANAAFLAERLNQDPRVEATHYPGLRSHPDHYLARSHFPSFGAMVSFSVPGGRAAAELVYNAVRVFGRLPSLGGVESGISHPATASHQGLTDEERATQGIGQGLLRLSIGIEHRDDLWSDLNQALASAAR